MSFAIVTDSLAGLPLAQIARRGLVVIPLSYTISGKEHLCLAPEGYDSAAFFQTMKLRGEVSTSMVPPHRFLTFLKPLLRSGLDLLFLSASSGLSSSYQSACMAAEQLREEFPQRKLQIVDSLSSSLGQGLLVLRAFDLRERGMCLEDTARTLLSLRHRIAHLFTVDDLMHLSRGGRLSGAKAMLGTALGLKPLLKARLQTAALSWCGEAMAGPELTGKLADQYNAPVRHPGDQTVCIAHGNAPQEAEALAQRLRQTNPPKEILIAPFDPANGCHAGPGALALFFEGDETVRLHP
ncbi:MAG: DegV family protein [Evtepia gabavorous]